MDDTVLKPAIRLRGAEAPHVDSRIALQTIIGFWLFYFVLNTIRMAIDSSPDQFTMLFRRGAVILIGYGVIPTLQPSADFGRVYLNFTPQTRALREEEAAQKSSPKDPDPK